MQIINIYMRIMKIMKKHRNQFQIYEYNENRNKHKYSINKCDNNKINENLRNQQYNQEHYENTENLYDN